MHVNTRCCIYVRILPKPHIQIFELAHSHIHTPSYIEPLTPHSIIQSLAHSCTHTHTHTYGFFLLSFFLPFCFLSPSLSLSIYPSLLSSIPGILVYPCLIHSARCQRIDGYCRRLEDRWSYNEIFWIQELQFPMFAIQTLCRLSIKAPDFKFLYLI